MMRNFNDAVSDSTGESDSTRVPMPVTISDMAGVSVEMMRNFNDAVSDYGRVR